MVDENNELTFVKIIDQDVELLLKTTPNLPEGSRIVNMRWSPWIIMSPDEGVSFFSFVGADGVFAMTMTLSRVDGKLTLSCDSELTLLCPGILPGYEPHAILWYEGVYNLPNQAPEALFAVIQHDGVELFGVTLNADRKIDIQRCFKVFLPLPACIAGYTFSDPLWMNYLDLNVCSTNGALSIFRIDLSDLTKSILLKASVPNFQGRTMIQNDPEFPEPNTFKRDFIDILDEKRDSFIEEWKIMQASCQVYGMAYFPLGGIVSVCYRLKPEGVLEYPIKERERCTLSWQLCRSWSEMFDPSRSIGSAKPFTLHGVPGEAFVSDIRFLVEPDDVEDSFNRMEEIIADGMAEAVGYPVAPVNPASGEEEDNHRFYSTKSSELPDIISLCLFNSTEAVLGRARNLLGLLKANKVAPKKPGVLSSQTGITKLILGTILEIPVLRRSQLRTPRSRMIMWLAASLGIVAFYRDERVFRLATECIAALEYRFDVDFSTEKKLIAERKEVLDNPGNLDLLVKMTKKIVRPGSMEKCKDCDRNVPLDDLMNGRCENGHLFKRCALTFLLITDPNSRVCGICSREYVTRKMVEEDETVVAALDARGERMDGDNVREPTLLRMLFEAVDTCVFCGGSFYDKEEFRRGAEQ
ncbi:hypothetical protein TWF481_008692 [Arthrobotrys musiformis]|uniref:Transcription factor IIIC putative zinc-finger domain-containing protein n=1 Tax=Arthrobotrys musiformis TaxID=47236 RepID=A0AAV9W7X5_9PEZI